MSDPVYTYDTSHISAFMKSHAEEQRREELRKRVALAQAISRNVEAVLGETLPEKDREVCDKVRKNMKIVLVTNKGYWKNLFNALLGKF
jgi:hypothetical protein